MPSREWQIGEETVLRSTPIFDLCSRAIRTPSDYSADYYYLKSFDWVNVIALTDAGEVVLIRQFRPNVGQYFLELPGGIVDPGEAPVDAALRELQEETGYRAKQLEHLASIRPNPAVHSNECHYFIGRGATFSAPPARESHEDITVELHHLVDLPRLISDGSFPHALMLAALLEFFIREKLVV